MVRVARPQASRRSSHEPYAGLDVSLEETAICVVDGTGRIDGETDISGKISRCGDELARTALCEAAHTLLVRSRKWSSLRASGMKIAKGRGMARARVAVARKLAVILHRMWSDQTEFRFGKEPGPSLAAA